MSDLIQPIYPWSKSSTITKGKNQELGNIISLNLIFVYYLLFVFVISGKLYPMLRQADVNLLGYLSGTVSILRYLVFNWWISIILFLVVLVVTFLFTVLITKTRFNLFKTYIEYLKIDTKNKTKKESFSTIFRDLLEIGGLSIISFLFLELITFAISSVITTLILPLSFDFTKISMSYFFLSILLAHIVFFPLLIYFYNRMITKKMVVKEGVDYKEFLTEDGEVDMEKWRKETWGKKPYSFDWEEEDVFPITCFSCGAIISSDLTICPICDTDLIKEIEAIESEFEDESEKEIEEVETQEDENNSNKNGTTDS